MCGIAGIYRFDGNCVEQSVLDDFTNSMIHRGPDGSGSKILNNQTLGLGHRRLSILDLSEAATQPMSYLNNRYWLTYNGEIFNFIELKEELKQKGYSFRSDSDSEVILASYHCWGTKCLQKFNGMWAFAIWDSEMKKLFLARDRFGIKPLYFLYIPYQIFAFASETNAFKKLEGFERAFNIGMVKKAMLSPFNLEAFGETIFKSIHQLKPGFKLLIDEYGVLNEEKWWETGLHLNKPVRNYHKQVELFKDIFEDSCKLRLRSDVEIATALSGGLDSSSVYCMLHNLKDKSEDSLRLPNKWLRAFSAIFPDTEQDEAFFAQKAANFVNGDLTYIHQETNNLPEKLEESVTHLDFIYNTPLFIGSDIYKGMKEHGISVSMDGHGVDEMMFGYPFTVFEYYGRLFNTNKDFSDEVWGIYEKLFFEKPEKPKWIRTKKNFSELIKNQIKRISDINGNKARMEDFAYKILYEQFHHTMLPTILRNFDKMAMQHSVEIRMPFMDWRLVTFMFSLSVKSKLGNGYTKRIVRDAMKGILPEQVRNRTLKLGLNAPMATWFGKELKDFILDNVNSKGFIQSDIWEGEKWCKFASERSISNNWTFNDSISFWPIFNTYLLMKNN